MSRYVMGIDVGTQSAKVVIFTAEGQVFCQASQPLRPLNIPAPAAAEHPDDDIWTAVQAACRQAMALFYQRGGQAHQLLAAGLCVIRCCRVLLQANGELATPVINWMDQRLNTPFQPREDYAAVRYVTTASGYITLRLTGQHRDTCANYIGWWPMDDNTGDWSHDTADFQRCNLQREMLFEVVKPGAILGKVTATAASTSGLPAGLPIVATAHDKAVEALGAGALSPGTALVSLGTYIGAMVHGSSQRHSAQHFWSFQSAVPGAFLYECMGVRRGMWTVSWFRDQFGAAALAEAEDRGESIENLLSREACRVPAGSEGLLTLHDWAAPADAEYRKGAILGFDGRHTRAHLFRSLLEGIALTLKNHMDPMAEERGQPFTQLVIAGGGANSDLFMQIFADVFGLPAQRNQMRSSAAIGCAINAGIATGLFSDYLSASQRLVHPEQTFMPDPQNTAHYARLNQVYQQLHRQLDPLFKQLNPLSGA
ncbi:sugar kinase [Enterobacterales bacterium CwR94]|nr:sugar kinase [Enterobacterales bacterium CwR94]